MLFLKPIADLTFEDVEEFCKRFRENIRVEYKSTFDDSVKKKLPRVLSSFANSYGGLLIIGVKTNSGVPVEPFDGIAFVDPEPRLTVENVCRSSIFPEPVIYQQLVPSRLPGSAFLVIQVNESQKAPHAIENSTQVYVRTGDSANPTTLADIALLERLLLRRREVLRRWEEFYAESESLAKAVGFPLDASRLELRIGPQYPTEIIITREKVSEFLSEHTRRQRVGFLHQEVLRHPSGAFLSRQGDSVRYLNIGEIGTVHYLEPLEFRRESEDKATLTNLWWITAPILRVISIVADLMKAHGVTCDLRIEASLANIAHVPFHTSQSVSFPQVLSAAFSLIPASLTHPSETLAERAGEVTTELLYQLRWPLGGHSSGRDVIGHIVADNYRRG